VLKTEEDERFKYVLTYIKDRSGNARFVTHYIPKEGPDCPKEMKAAMEYLEMKTFNGCPESPYEQCYFTTLDNELGADIFNRTADRAHKYFDYLGEGFNKACELLIEIDGSLHEVGLNILDYPPEEPASIITMSGTDVPDTSSISRGIGEETEQLYKWEVFISHASEDKDIFVRQLAVELESVGLHVWYDESTLTIGDRLRESIEKGLLKSRYGVVVLSTNFFNKQWPQDELSGLAVRERNGEKVILPVWLDIDRDYVASYSTILANRVAARTSEGMGKVVSDILAVVKPI